MYSGTFSPRHDNQTASHSGTLCHSRCYIRLFINQDKADPEQQLPGNTDNSFIPRHPFQVVMVVKHQLRIFSYSHPTVLDQNGAKVSIPTMLQRTNVLRITTTPEELLWRNVPGEPILQNWSIHQTA